MNYKNISQLFFISMSMLLFTSCIEEIDFETETFESALVIEATITNEVKNQEILLSRTYQFEEDGPNPESNATVIVETENSIFSFNEIEPGRYVSTNEFGAVTNEAYQLKINTSNGRSYVSSPTFLTQVTQIDDVYAVRETNDDGENGMSIYVDSYDPTGNSKYYRYDYEETYKIVSPTWSPKDVIVLDDLTCEVDLINKAQEEKTCYNTEESLRINLFATNELTEDRVNRHLIRFIGSDNYIMSHRYSILVKQYIQSREAFNYFKTLKDFSEEGSLFSQTQPGFFNGNIVSEINSEEKVIGFFDVSTVSSQRIFFNYDDYYPNEDLPPFFIACEPTEHYQYTTTGLCGSLISELERDRVVYHSGVEKILDTEISNDSILVGNFLMVLRPCGDCTALGSNIVPDFWTD